VEGDFPVAWTNRSGQGRMFYTSLGHREDVYLNPLYQGHLIGGIKWALGLENGDDTPGNPIK
jgi:type 1 glutamine amidotransferase